MTQIQVSLQSPRIQTRAVDGTWLSLNFWLDKPNFCFLYSKTTDFFCRKKFKSEARSSGFPRCALVQWSVLGEEPSLCCCSGEPGAWEDFCWKNMASWEGRQTKPVGSGFIIEQQSPVKGATDPCFVQWSRERVQMQPGGRACFLSKCTLALLSQLTVLRAIQGPEPFQVNFLIYCHLPISALPPHPEVPFTLRYLLLLLLPIVKRKKNKKSTSPLLADMSSPMWFPLQRSSLTSLPHLLLPVVPAEPLLGPPFKITVILNWENNWLSLSSLLLSRGFQQPPFQQLFIAANNTPVAGQAHSSSVEEHLWGAAMRAALPFFLSYVSHGALCAQICSPLESKRHPLPEARILFTVIL